MKPVAVHLVLACLLHVAQAQPDLPFAAVRTNALPRLQYPKLALYKQYLFLAGGALNDSISRDLYFANTSGEFSWYKTSLPTPNPLIQIPSYNLLGIHTLNSSILFIFSNPTAIETHLLNLVTGAWSVPKTAGTSKFLGVPSPTIPAMAVGCSFLTSDSSAVILHGQVVGTGTTYVHLLDTQTMGWVRVTTPRYSKSGVGCVDVDGGGIVIGGSTNDGSISSAKISGERFSVSDSLWSELAAENPPDNVLDMVGVVRRNDEIFVYGGVFLDGNLSNGLYKLTGVNGRWTSEGNNTAACCGASMYDKSRDIIFMVFPGASGMSHLVYRPATKSWISDSQIDPISKLNPSLSAVTSTQVLSLPTNPVSTPEKNNESSSALITGIVVAIILVILILIAMILLRNKKSRERFSIESKYLFERLLSIFKRKGKTETTGKSVRDDPTEKDVYYPSSPYASTEYSTAPSAPSDIVAPVATVKEYIPKQIQRIHKNDSATELEKDKANIQVIAATREFVPSSQCDEIVIRTGDLVSINIGDYFDDGWCLGVNETCKIVGIFPVGCITNSSAKTPAPVYPRISSLSPEIPDRIEQLKSAYFKALSTHLLSQTPPRSALKSTNSQKTKKSVKIISPASNDSSSESGSVIDYYEHGSEAGEGGGGKEGFAVPIRASSKDFVLPVSSLSRK